MPGLPKVIVHAAGTGKVNYVHQPYHRAHRMTFARVTVVTQLLTSGEKVRRWRVIGQKSPSLSPSVICEKPL